MGFYVPSQDLQPALEFGVRPDREKGVRVAVASVAISKFPLMDQSLGP
jgi:hypothetical protein